MPAYKGKWNVGWTKSGAILPEKIHGKYWMYYLGDAADRETQMSIASSTDLMHWEDVSKSSGSLQLTENVRFPRRRTWTAAINDRKWHFSRL